MKRNKTSGVEKQERKRPEDDYNTNTNEGTIVLNTNCKYHVVLLTNNVMQHANKYKKYIINEYIHTYIQT